MSAKANWSVTNLVDNAAKSVYHDANSGWEGENENSKWCSGENRKAILKEVANASVSTIVVTVKSIFSEYDSAGVANTSYCLPVDEHVGSKIASFHDLFLVEHWENVYPANREAKRCNC